MGKGTNDLSEAAQEIETAADISADGLDGPEGAEYNEDSRVPFGSNEERLGYEKREGYHRHWFNDSPGRLQRALKAGYKHVLDKETGKNVSVPVGVAPNGGVLMGFLMEIPLEWWKKDLALGQERVDKTDADIRRGNIQGKVGEDGRYVPENRPIRMTRNSRPTG